MKQTIIIITCLLMCLILIACDNKPNEEEDMIKKITYEEIYNNRKEPYPVVEYGRLNKASYGYYMKYEQGYNGWYYRYEHNGEILSLELSNNKWVHQNSYMDGPEIHIVDNVTLFREFRPNFDGKAYIYGNYKTLEGNGTALLEIFINDINVYNKEIIGYDSKGFFLDMVEDLNKDDIIYFKISGTNARVYFNPTVSFDEDSNTSLYTLDIRGNYYGDMFFYYDYDERALYDLYLWNDNAMKNPYHHEFEKTYDFFNWEEPSAQEIEKVLNNHYIYRTMDVQRFNNDSIYPGGIRDHFIYKEIENNRMLIISQNVKEFGDGKMNTDLTIRVSKDIYGFDWYDPIVIESYRNQQEGLPECPSIVKIGDRYYILVSVAYQTVHQVGQLRYYSGDAGVDILDVDWGSKDYRVMDGEDLVAGQFVQVGDKVYMFGWIPRTYHTMPWAPWGGYKNIPREVIELGNGVLGSRLDPYLTQQLNKGRTHDLPYEITSTISGQAIKDEYTFTTLGVNNQFKINEYYKRTFIEFDMEFGNSTKGYIEFYQNNARYQIGIERELDKTYMVVRSPNDLYHTLNSKIEIPRSSKYTIKIINDGPFIEFFVNDQYSLTAHTAMNIDSYSIGFYADNKETTFSNLYIGKLSGKRDIND